MEELWVAQYRMFESRVFFFSSRRRHTRFDCDWSSDVCSSDLVVLQSEAEVLTAMREQALESSDTELKALMLEERRLRNQLLKYELEKMQLKKSDRKSVV